ncbi:hypothetical protein AN958_02744 [Leucoagaricus sp. SymC.cos]|nr:hypothetical protein AN958_02744 [Leucoagaricus sp. SymC.cos]
MSIPINKDVWIEIMRYFSISLADDQPDEIKAKRRVLLSLALTASDLVSIALDELWKSMTTLEPIVQIMNYTPTPVGNSGSETPLTFTNSYWVSTHQALTEKLRSHISTYLSRIRYLHFADFPSPREYTLWHALSAFGNWRNSLVPGLKSLSLSVSGIDPTMAYNVTPILSPNLKALTLHDQSFGWMGESVSTIILDILKHRDIAILEVEYRGFTSSRVVRRIFGFPTLQTVAIPAQGQVTPMTDAEMKPFKGTTSLTNLDIHLAVFAAPRTARNWLTSLTSLSDITLRGTLRNIFQVLRGDQIISVQSFGLDIAVDSSNHSQETVARLIPLIGINSSNLHTLRLEATIRQHGFAPLTLTDVLALREKPLQTLVLRHCLTLGSPNNELIDIITVWPALKHMCIVTYNNQLGDASVVLPYYSKHAPFLRTATLPVEFSSDSGSLGESFSPAFNQSACPLHRLEIPSANFYLSTQMMLEVARDLVVSFPRLTKINSSDDNPPGLRDFQVAIGIFQTFLALPPKRADKLYISEVSIVNIKTVHD